MKTLGWAVTFILTGCTQSIDHRNRDMDVGDNKWCAYRVTASVEWWNEYAPLFSDASATLISLAYTEDRLNFPFGRNEIRYYTATCDLDFSYLFEGMPVAHEPIELAVYESERQLWLKSFQTQYVRKLEKNRARYRFPACKPATAGPDRLS